MYKHTRNAILLLLFGAGLAACSDDPVSPDDGDPIQQQQAIEADLAVQVAGDAVVAEVAIEDAAFSIFSSPYAPDGPFGPVRDKFREARDAMAAGDTARARELAHDGRILLVEGIIALRGPEVIDQLFGRVEKLLERMDEAGDEFEQLDRVRDRMQDLFDEAGEFRDAGDMVAAGERLVLALQIADRMRHRHRDFRLNPQQHARLALTRAGHAIQLANRIIGDDISPRQTEVLERAIALFERGKHAFENGEYRRSVILSRRAEGLSLFAVLEGEPPTVAEAQKFLELADTLIAEAKAAVGDAPTPAESAILQRAIHLRNMGARAINNWNWRGVGLLWHSAVTSATLL